MNRNEIWTSNPIHAVHTRHNEPAWHSSSCIYFSVSNFQKCWCRYMLYIVTWWCYSFAFESCLHLLGPLPSTPFALRSRDPAFFIISNMNQDTRIFFFKKCLDRDKVSHTYRQSIQPFWHFSIKKKGEQCCKLPHIWRSKPSIHIFSEINICGMLNVNINIVF